MRLRCLDPKKRNFIERSVILRALNPVTLSEDLRKQYTSEGFSDLQVSSIKIENENNFTLDTKELEMN